MIQRPIVLACLVWGIGCAASPKLPRSPSAPTTLAIHAEAALLNDFQKGNDGFGWSGTADLGFEFPGCCSVGFYAGYTILGDDGAKKAWADTIVDIGPELGIVLPVWDHRLRLRLRAGKALAAAPPRLGRDGFSGSGAFLVRVSGVRAPAVNEGAAQVDLFLGSAGWWVGPEQSPAGPLGESFAQAAMFVFGVRLGAGDGVDFQ